MYCPPPRALTKGRGKGGAAGRAKHCPPYGAMLGTGVVAAGMTTAPVLSRQGLRPTAPPPAPPASCQVAPQLQRPGQGAHPGHGPQGPRPQLVLRQPGSPLPVPVEVVVSRPAQGSDAAGKNVRTVAFEPEFTLEKNQRCSSLTVQRPQREDDSSHARSSGLAFRLHIRTMSGCTVSSLMSESSIDRNSTRTAGSDPQDSQGSHISPAGATEAPISISPQSSAAGERVERRRLPSEGSTDDCNKC